MTQTKDQGYERRRDMLLRRIRQTEGDWVQEVVPSSQRKVVRKRKNKQRDETNH